MIYFLHGKDSYRMRQRQNEIIADSGAKDFLRAGKENFNPAELEELTRSASLFGEKKAAVCEGIMGEEFILKNLGGFAESPNIFIFCEEDVSDDILDAIKKNGGKISKFGALTGEKLKEWIKEEIKKRKVSVSPKAQAEIIKNCGPDLWCVSKELEMAGLGAEISASGPEEEYNPFQICDAVAAKDRKKAWTLFQKALLLGVTAEEVFWKVAWEIKNLMLMKNLDAAGVKNIEKESGLHPFVAKKARSFSRNFEFDDLNRMSWELVEIYHNTRRGLDEFETGLEKFLISI